MSRVLVIGLDGATFDLISPFIAQGKLPNLQRLMQNGASAPLDSTIPPVTASAWTSFMTGKNPGKHGLFDFMRRRDGSYDLQPASSRDRNGKAMWELAGEAGKRSIVMGVPVTYPPTPLNGLMVTGMLTPRGAPDYTYPAELADEIRDAVGEYVVYSDEVYARGRGQTFLHALHYSVQQRAKTAAYLLHKYDWDLGILVFPETDSVCHGLWWAYDPTHHQHNQPDMTRLRDGICEIYADIDGYFGELVNSLPPDTNVLVMSDHGHGPLRNFLYVNNFLQQRGYLKVKRTLDSRVKRVAFEMGLTPRTAYGMMLQLGLGKVRRTLDKRRGGRGLLKRFFLSLNDVDWSRTRAYSIGYIGEVHINLRGREPLGIVEPGAEYERVRNELIRDLKALTCPDGFPLIERVWKKEEIYRGAHLEDAPDILFFPKNLETIAFGDFEFGSNKVVEPAYGVSSSHRMEGVLVAQGPDIRAGATIACPSLIDLAPTILHMLDLPVPDGMDGRVLTEMLGTATPVRVGGSAEREHSGSDGYSDEQEEEVLQRLQDLGYLS